MPDGAPHLDRPPGDARAYVTLVTNADYLPGAVALVRLARLHRHHRRHRRAPHRRRRGGRRSRRSPRSAPGSPPATSCRPPTPSTPRIPARAQHERAPFTKGEKPAFHTPLDNFVKLRLWQLPYERVVFLDADTLVLRPIDRLFDYPEFSAAPNVYESLADFRRLNSGVFTARPSHRDLRRDARPPRHPRRLLEAHRPDLPRSLLPRLAGPAGLRQPAAIRLVQPARALGLVARSASCTSSTRSPGTRPTPRPTASRR